MISVMWLFMNLTIMVKNIQCSERHWQILADLKFWKVEFDASIGSMIWKQHEYVVTITLKRMQILSIFYSPVKSKNKYIP